MSTPIAADTSRLWFALVGGMLIGTLGGLIGLGGAEFRLPLLIGLFGFAALFAVILNKAMSLVVVASALLFRTKAVPIDEVQAIADGLDDSCRVARQKWCGSTQDALPSCFDDRKAPASSHQPLAAKHERGVVCT